MAEEERLCSRCGARYDSEVIFCPKDGTPLGTKKTEIIDDPYLGIELGGEYRIEQLIGIGAMGRVYRAHQKGIERDVAVKIIHRELLRNPTLMARFAREARVASRLAHPNVVQVLSTGEIPRLNADVGGEAYLVMEYLDGISLRSALAASGGSMPLPRALHVVLQVCDAVGEAHAQNIVHRDVKPENVMLVRRGDDPDFVKVLDFGVARITSTDASVATQAGVIFGTARYISPEGAQGKTVGPAGDVYSIAVILFQCLSGQTPFDAENPVAILIKHTHEPAPDVRSIARSSYVPEPLAQAIAANLAKDPADRCRDARELGRALVDAARASGLSPDDLVMRSTLLGGAGRALSLASLQRTRSLALSPELASEMGRGDTVPSEPESAEPRRPSRPAESQRTSPRTGVEPTLSDEPVSSTHLSRPSWHPPQEVSSSSGLPPTSAHPTPSSASWEPPLEPVVAGRRRMLVAASFVVGAGIALFVADRVGVFRSPEPGVEAWAARARIAASAGAWDAPPGENVRDITDAALRRWPGAPGVISIRRDAAQRLAERAESLKANDPDDALHWATLAAELDPGNERARSLYAELARPPAAPSSDPVPSGSGGPAPQKPPPLVPSPKTQPVPSAASTVEPVPVPPPESSGGRWL
jgi:serine/threonine-protein kinase